MLRPVRDARGAPGADRAHRQLVERGALFGGEGAEEFVLDSPEPYLSRRRRRAHGTARGRTPGR
ncbi:hypothetical protein [Streptomyces sp. NPDC006638]|uniref:hypothetical protein n=1 Tax=Streptomyces sp. NPDC006638 TaxID=3157183 RepID=UPI0033B49219